MTMTPRTMSYVLFVAAAAVMFGGLFAFIFNQVMTRNNENAFMIDSGFLGLFAITLGALLRKVNDISSSSVAEASALTAMGIIGSCLALPVLARIILALVTSAVNSAPALYTSVAFSILSILAIGLISAYVARDQIKRIQSDDDEGYAIMETLYNKSTLSIVTIIFSFFLFGLSMALFVERWRPYHVVTTNLHAMMLFATGVLGYFTNRLRVTHMNVWHKTMTTFTIGIGVASTVAVIQLLVYYASDIQYSRWKRADFTVLALSQATFTFLGLIVSALTGVASDDIQTATPKYSKMPIAEKINAGMFASALVASSMAVFDMAIMNYPTYGFPALIVTAMVLVAAKHGISIQTTGNQLAKYPYYALNIFNSVGSIWAVSMTVYEFLTTINSLSSLTLTYSPFAFIFAGLTIATLLPVTYYCIRAAIQSHKDLTTVNDNRLTIA